MKFMILDTETTGVRAREHRNIEIAYQTVDLRRECLEVLTPVSVRRFKPVAHTAFEPKAYEVNGYYEGHPDWADAPEIDSPDAAISWRQFADEAKGFFAAGHNVSFDTFFVAETLKRVNAPYPFHYRAFDTMTFAALGAIFKGTEGWNLVEAYKNAGGRELEGPQALRPHRAETDVIMVKRMMEVGRKAWACLEAAGFTT